MKYTHQRIKKKKTPLQPAKKEMIGETRAKRLFLSI